jgi:hypothetical protein
MTASDHIDWEELHELDRREDEAKALEAGLVDVGLGQGPAEVRQQLLQEEHKMIKATSEDFQEQKAAPQSGNGLLPEDQAALDEAERLIAACVLAPEDGDDPGAKAEITRPMVEKNLPQFAIFRTKPLFDLWGVPAREGMKEIVYVTTKDFAPNFDEDVDLRRVRFYEAVTAPPDNVSLLTWAFIPETDGRGSNDWTATRFDAMEQAIERWTTMRSRKKLSRYVYRPARKDHGEPRFSGLTPGQHLLNLKKMGWMVESTDHHYFKKVTDTE